MHHQIEKGERPATPTGRVAIPEAFAGGIEWGLVLDGTSEVEGLVVAPSGAVVAVGELSGSVELGDTTLVASGNARDLFLAVIRPGL